ncbi:MAG: ParB-like nuclease domain-containing protein [Patescibacteria group bacterium]|nr:ParB-like nuclease domain-containing protein [Patescibacteria group bacterium]
MTTASEKAVIEVYANLRRRLRDVVWDTTMIDPKVLDHHPLNANRDQEPLPAEWLANVKCYGVTFEIAVAKVDGRLRILSGHRRKRAAVQCDIPLVPVKLAREPMDEVLQCLIWAQGNITPEEYDARKRCELDKFQIIPTLQNIISSELSKQKFPHMENPPPDVRVSPVVVAQAVLGVNEKLAQAGVRAATQVAESRAKGDEATAVAVENAFETSIKRSNELVDEVKKTGRVDRSDKELASRKTKQAPTSSIPPEMQEIFDSRKEFRRLSRLCNTVRQDLGELAKQKAGSWLDIPAISTIIEDLKAFIKHAQPYAECAKCRRDAESRKTCACCKGLGFVTKPIASKSFSQPDHDWLITQGSDAEMEFNQQ